MKGILSLDDLEEAARKKAAAEAATLQSITDNKYDDAWIDAALRAKGVTLP